MNHAEKVALVGRINAVTASAGRMCPYCKAKKVDVDFVGQLDASDSRPAIDVTVYRCQVCPGRWVDGKEAKI